MVYFNNLDDNLRIYLFKSNTVSSLTQTFNNINYAMVNRSNLRILATNDGIEQLQILICWHLLPYRFA